MTGHDAIAMLRGIAPPIETPDRGQAEGSLHADPPAPEPTTASPTSSVPGVASLSIADLIPSQEALALLLETDPLHLTDRDLDAIIAYNREHRRKLAAGIIKKGQRAAPKKKSPPKKKAPNAPSQEETDN